MSQSSDSRVDYILTLEGREVKFVSKFKYEEELNSPYCMELQVALKVGRDEDAATVNRDLRHKNVSLKIERDGHENASYEFKGLVSSSMYAYAPADLEDTEGSTESRLFELEIVPAFALLEHHKDKPQAWHNRTYAYVLEQVLEQELAVYGRTVDNRAQPGPTIQLITRSPGESALAFVQRLLYESGINSFMDFEAWPTEVLVLADTNEGFTPAKLPFDTPISLTQSEGASFVTDVKYLAKSGSS